MVSLSTETVIRSRSSFFLYELNSSSNIQPTTKAFSDFLRLFSVSVSLDHAQFTLWTLKTISFYTTTFFCRHSPNPTTVFVDPGQFVVKVRSGEGGGLEKTNRHALCRLPNCRTATTEKFSRFVKCGPLATRHLTLKA